MYNSGRIKKKGTSFFHRDGRFRRKSISPDSYLAMSKVKEGEVARDPASIEDVKTAGSFLSPISGGVKREAKRRDGEGRRR